MCQIDEIVFFKTKMDLTSDFVSFLKAPLFQVLDNKLLSNMAAFWELVESGWGFVIKLRYGLLGTVPQCQRFIMKAHSIRISPFQQLRAPHTEGVCFTLNRPEFISSDSPLYLGTWAHSSELHLITGVSVCLKVNPVQFAYSVSTTELSSEPKRGSESKRVVFLLLFSSWSVTVTCSGAPNKHLLLMRSCCPGGLIYFKKCSVKVNQTKWRSKILLPLTITVWTLPQFLLRLLSDQTLMNELLSDTHSFYHFSCYFLLS